MKTNESRRNEKKKEEEKERKYIHLSKEASILCFFLFAFFPSKNV